MDAPLPAWLTETFAPAALPKPKSKMPDLDKPIGSYGVMAPPPAPDFTRLPAEVKPLERAQRLDKLLDKAIDVTEEILDMPFLVPGEDDFGKVLAAKQNAAGSVMNIALKADENKFRAQSTDRLVSLLETVLKAEKVVDAAEAAGTVIEGDVTDVTPS